MAKRIRIVNSIMIVILFSTSSLLAQEVKDQANQQMPRDSLLKIARNIVNSSSCRVLVTVDENGKPHAREMAPFTPEENWKIWLGTTTGSRKTKQIQDNPNVTVFYYDPDGKSYVSVAGIARLVNDKDKKEKYWDDAWTQFYPDKENNYILIEVTPANLEICSFKYNIFWDSTGDSKIIDLAP
jgi:general stress protein 26